ncbi:hypothetical protein JW823_04940 [bacterium]|nr:hypothetical protein [candidate division CSSED10-310 bacterium]
MASRKKNYRHRNPSGRYEENSNNPNYMNNQRSGHSSERENQYYCEICGYTVPQTGNIPPMCTRCMIPMNMLRSSNLNRSKMEKKQSFDYSSRIFYQTDGHPQYKGLPLDHPDPEDPDAVEAYRARKEGGRRRPARSQGGDFRSANRQTSDHQRRRSPHPATHQQPRRNQEIKQPPPLEQPAPVEPVSPPADVKQVSEDVQRSGDYKRERRRRAPARRVVATSPDQKEIEFAAQVEKESPKLREDDYAGTALTSDRSAATILSDTMKEVGSDHRGNLRSDYAYSRGDSKDDGKPVESLATESEKDESTTE